MKGRKILFGGKWKEDILRYAQSNRALFGLGIINTIATGFLVIGYLNLKDNIIVNVEVPGRELTYGQLQANQDSHELFARDIMVNLGEFESSTIASQIRHVMPKFDDAFLRTYKNKLEMMQNNIIKGNISQKIKPIKISTTLNSKGHTATVTMDAYVSRKVGDIDIFINKPCSFTIETVVRGGLLYATSYSDSCDN